MMLDHLRRMARYNRWANARLYAACDGLDEEVYSARRPAFFGSIHNTLNHVYVADVLWLERIEGRPPTPWALDHVPHPTRDGLAEARAVLDETLIQATDDTQEADLAGNAVYRMVSAPEKDMHTPRYLCWLHVFNHQTHHRGQVHDMLTQTTVPPPPLDLMIHLREAEPR